MAMTQRADHSAASKADLEVFPIQTPIHIVIFVLIGGDGAQQPHVCHA